MTTPTEAYKAPLEAGDMEFVKYRRSQIAELHRWRPGDDMSRVSISASDLEAGSPKLGDMIARNPKNHADRWLVAADYFAENFEPVSLPIPDFPSDPREFGSEPKGCPTPGACSCGPGPRLTAVDAAPDPREESIMRCNICGFVIDTKYEATKPNIDFTMTGRTKHASPEPRLTALAQTIRAEILKCRLLVSQKDAPREQMSTRIAALEWMLSKMEDKP